MNNRIFTILLITLSLTFFKANASHIVGGEFYYKYVGDTTVSIYTLHKYQITLSIYEDCINGQPDAIATDDPAYLTIFDGRDSIIGGDTGLHSNPLITVPVNFSNSCVSNVPPTCLYKRTFVKTYYLPTNSSGYIISYQRCCRNNTVANIFEPGNTGSTYYCTIPPANSADNPAGLYNSSAVFKNYPPQIICRNEPLYYDHSATDPDGDSLSYEFCYAVLGASSDNVKPFPESTPPYKSVTYISPYSSTQPLPGYPVIQIDATTGFITGTPDLAGRYLVTVCCNEWRNGAIINTVKREFQFVVTDCSKKVVADIPQYSTDPNTYVVSCTDFTVNFQNTSTGGFSYHWNFGLPDVASDTSAAEYPTFTYPDTGTFAVKLVVNPASTCPDSITRLVKVYPTFHAAFTDSGLLCPKMLISFTDHSSASIKPVNYWLWDFGDGVTSSDENPTHTYQHGGIYDVTLISKNIKNCVDTVLQNISIENFKPFAGNDTFILKGQSIYFDATGGTTYAWSPPTNLSDTSVNNPVGFYPDTGIYTYTVNVKSDYGCYGDDTIQVGVVNQPEFFVPSAFTPNGDGLNDLFRPLAVGYKTINYFRVFNRWGQQVFYGQSFEEGWDGTFHGEKAEMGTYFWEISFTDIHNKTSFLKGDVMLIR